MIIQYLKNIKHKLQELKRNFLIDLDLYLSLKRINKRIQKKRKCNVKNNNKINICFVLQEYSLFDKLYNIFLELKKHNDVYLKAIVLPPYDIKTNTINKYDHTNLDLFISKIGKDSIISEDEFDKIEFDYIFINRPYDHYVEEKFRVINLYKRGKICYLPYANGLTTSLTKLNIDNEFNCYVNLFFSDNKVIYNGVKNKYKIQNALGIKKVYDEGYPALETYVDYHYYNSLKNDKTINILYTPRWSSEGEFGGSSFLFIKDEILQLSKNKNIHLIFRPHPMMFDNFIRNKKMSENEVIEFRKELVNNGAILYEKGLVCDILDNVDIFLTDYSSLIMNYYLTGKPIIYIDTKIMEILDEFKFVFDYNYIVNYDESIVKIVEDIIRQKDYKYNDRIKRVIEESELFRGSTKRIVNDIVNDYYKGKL